MKVVGGYSVSYIIERLSILKLAGAYSREDAFDKATAFFALSSETGFTPYHALAKHSFCMVICGFNIFVSNKGPKKFPVAIECSANGTHDGKVGAFFEKSFNHEAKWTHLLLKLNSVNHSILMAML